MVVASSKLEIDKPSFPKLMLGKNTGCVYLVLEAETNNSERSLKTMVIDPRGSAERKIGTINWYRDTLLKPFDGEVTLRNY